MQIFTKIRINFLKKRIISDVFPTREIIAKLLQNFIMKGANIKQTLPIQFFFLFVFAAGGNCQTQPIEISVGAGYEINNFDWSIAGNLDGQSPNILSELKFNRITSVGVYALGKYKVTNRFKVNVFYQRNGVTSGQGTDIDYASDNRTNPTFNETFLSNKGVMQILKAGGNYSFFKKSKLTLAGGLHYIAGSGTYYLLSDRLSDLESSYRVKLQAVELSLNADYLAGSAIMISANVGYSISRYKGTADWNLIDVFKHPVSFVQRSNARGIMGEVNVKYQFSKHLAIAGSGIINHTAINKGTDVSYLKNNTEIQTRFNGGDLVSYGVRCSLVYGF